MVHHLAHRACVFEDHTLQVSNVIIDADAPSIALNMFVPNREAVFVELY